MWSPKATKFHDRFVIDYAWTHEIQTLQSQCLHGNEKFLETILLYSTSTDDVQSNLIKI